MDILRLFYKIGDTMKKYIPVLLTLSLALGFAMTGCNNKENINSELSEESIMSVSQNESEPVSVIESESATDIKESENISIIPNDEEKELPVFTESYGVFDEFLSGKKDCIRITELGEELHTFSVADLCFDSEDDPFSYRTDNIQMKDLDNDGEDELIINNVNGGMYIDYDGTNFRTLAASGGTAEMLGYVESEGEVLIFYYDVLHSGRECYYFYKYKGADQIVDQYDLYAYWDEDNDNFDENSEFIYRGQNITMEEFLNLRSGIIFR